MHKHKHTHLLVQAVDTVTFRPKLQDTDIYRISCDLYRLVLSVTKKIKHSLNLSPAGSGQVLNVSIVAEWFYS